jgi:hypothetical protein
MVIVDDDQCPQCEDGIISVAAPVCDECGFAMGAESVEWQQPPSAVEARDGLPQ